eukprot:2495283-Pleurochrysis_carterae.AAC.2
MTQASLAAVTVCRDFTKASDDDVLSGLKTANRRVAYPKHLLDCQGQTEISKSRSLAINGLSRRQSWECPAEVLQTTLTLKEA